MKVEVVPVYGNGWFDVVLQQPMPTPMPFSITIIHDTAPIIGRVYTSGHKFEGYCAILQQRYKDEQNNYNVEIVDQPSDGVSTEHSTVICNGYALVTAMPGAAITT
jgi:hypothetical protein